MATRATGRGGDQRAKIGNEVGHPRLQAKQSRTWHTEQMQGDRQQYRHNGATQELPEQPAAQHLAHLVQDGAHAHPCAYRHELQRTLSVTSRISGEEQA